MNKTIKILLCILIICSTMLLGWYVGKDILNKEDSKYSSINNNSNQKSSQQVENTKNDSNPEKTTNQSNSKYNQYLGYWYESKDHYKDYNPSSLNIKKVNDKEMILDLYISRIANFDDIKVNLNDYTFEATSDNGLSNNGEVAKITGKLIINEEEVILNILTSNLKDYDKEQISFKYHREETKINNSLGVWYESKDYLKDYNPSIVNIKKIADNQILIDLYISRIANFDDIKVNLNDYTFEATSDNGLSNNGEVAKITGKLVIYDDEIIVKIKTSNLKDYDKEEISFKYQTKEVNINSYKGTWYESEQHKNDKNPSTINIKSIKNNQLTFDLYISRLANFDNITINISEEGFEATSDNAITNDNNPAKITGYVRFDNGEVIVLIKDSNIKGIDSNTNYRFTYKNK